MNLLVTYLLFCALPLLLAWAAIVAAGLLLIRWSERGERREQQTYLPPPTGGLEQVLRRWQAPDSVLSQSP
jgi:hypothetical protein